MSCPAVVFGLVIAFEVTTTWSRLPLSARPSAVSDCPRV